MLRVTADPNVTATRLDYLDERDARLASETFDFGGMDFMFLVVGNRPTIPNVQTPDEKGGRPKFSLL